MPVATIKYINVVTAYKFQKVISQDNLPNFGMPSNWSTLANQIFPGIATHFREDQSYHSLTNLIKSIRFFTAILLDKVSIPGVVIDEGLKTLIKEKIMEGVPHCSEGLHGRLNALYGMFFVPKTVAELLQRVRQDIIDIGAYVHRNDDRQRNNNGAHDVNAVNYIILQAAKQGYGIQTANAQDDYGHLFIAEHIAIKAVHTIFKEKYTPLNILSLLSQQLRTLLANNFAYRGQLQEEGYEEGEYAKFKEYLNEILACDFSDQDILVFDDDYFNIIDINWPLINQKLWSHIKDCFILPEEQLKAFDELYASVDINSKASMKNFECLISLFSSFENYQQLISLFSELESSKKIELLGVLFKKNPESLSETNLFKLIDENKNNLEYISCLRQKLLQVSPSYLSLYERELSQGINHPLVGYFNHGSCSINNIFSKLQIINPQKQVEILASVLENDVSVLQSILGYNFSFKSFSFDRLTTTQKQQLANYKTLPRLFSLLNAFSKEQLEMFFYCNSFVQSSLQYNRASLLPILELLKGVDAEVIQHCFNFMCQDGQPILFSLFNLNGALNKNYHDHSDMPLSKEEVATVIDSVLELLEKLPEQKRNDYFSEVFLSNSDVLLMLKDSDLTQKQAKKLLSLIDINIIKNNVEQMPDIKQGAHTEQIDIDNLIFLIGVCQAEIAYQIMKIKVIKKSFMITTESSLARKMFFSKEHVLKSHEVFQQLTIEQKATISRLILKEPEGFIKWTSKMNGCHEVSLFFDVISSTPIEYRLQVLNYSIQSNFSIFAKGDATDNILYLMKQLKINNSVSLLKIKVGLWGFRKYFHEKIINDTKYHKALLTYLKSLTDVSEKASILESIFEKKEDFIERTLVSHQSLRQSVELCIQVPNVIKMKSLSTFLISDNFSIACISNLLEIMGSLDISQRQALYLIKPGCSTKTLLQIIIERKPTSLFIINRMLNQMDKGNAEAFINDAMIYPINISDDLADDFSESFNDVLILMDYFPKDQYFGLFNAMNNAMRNKEDVTFYFTILVQASLAQIKQTLQYVKAPSGLKALESMVFQVNYKEMLDESLSFILQNIDLSQIEPVNMFNINHLELNAESNIDKINAAFKFSLSLSTLQKKLAISWWKKFDAEPDFKLKLLNDNKSLFSESDTTLLFDFDNVNKNSILYSHVLKGGSLSDDFWLEIVDKITDEHFYALITTELYNDQFGELSSLIMLLSQQNPVDFIKVYEWVLNRKTSEQKTQTLASIYSMSDNLLLKLFQQPEVHYSDFIRFSRNMPIETIRQNFISILPINHLSGTNINKQFINLIKGYMADENNKALLASVFLTKSERHKLLFIEFLEKDLNILEAALPLFNCFTEQEKLEVFTHTFHGCFNLYSYLFKKERIFSSYQNVKPLTAAQTNVLKYICTMPAKSWSACTRNDVDFFYKLALLGEKKLQTQYFIEANQSLLNTIVNESAMSKFYPRSGLSPSIIDDAIEDKNGLHLNFLKTIESKLHPENIKNIFSFSNSKKQTLALCTLIKGGDKLPCFMKGLSKIDYKGQQYILRNCYKKGKSLIKKETQLWVDFKLQILALEERSDSFSWLGNTADDRKAHRVTAMLVKQLNQTYHAALSGSDIEKQETFALLKKSLNDPKTRNVLNQHRGIKKIVVNILAAIIGLGFGYLLACSVNLYLTDGKHFFFHPQTETDKLADALTLKSNEIERSYLSASLDV